MTRPSLADRLSELVVTVLGLGKLPLARGTWGTLGAVAVYALAAGTVGTAEHPWFLPALTLVLTLACIAYGPWAERFYRRKDPPRVVLDEVAGYLLAVSFFPAAEPLRVGLLTFVLFRLFDIVKPFPARRSQKLPAGLGVVADDLIAGAYAALLTWPALRLFWG